MNLVMALLLAIVASFFGVAQAGQLEAAPRAISATSSAPAAPPAAQASAAAPAMNPVASGARLAPTMLVCPSAADAITMSSPPVCEPSHVYAYAAPAGWVLGDPVPAWVSAP
jgi:hypothetical protein